MKAKLKKSRLKLTKAEEKRDRVAEKITKKKRQRLYEKEKPKSKLDFCENKPKPSDKLMEKPKPQSQLSKVFKTVPQKTLIKSLHSEIAKNEDDNVGVKSAHNTEQSAESMGRKLKSAYEHQKLKPYKNYLKAQKNMRKTQINYSYQKVVSENPQIASNSLSKWKQKQNIKKQYYKAHKTGKTTQKTTATIKNTVKKSVDVVNKAVVNIVKNPKILIICLISLLIIVIMGSIFSSCSVLLEGGLSSIVGTSYNSEDEDIVEVDNNYRGLEDELKEKIKNIESVYPNYNEYRYDLDEIGHNSYELASYLTALLKYYKPNEVQDELQKVFELQYALEFKSEVEIRYRTKRRTDSEGNSYTVKVSYKYYILNITLTNTPIIEIAESVLTEESFELFKVYLEMKGNKPQLFGD